MLEVTIKSVELEVHFHFDKKDVLWLTSLHVADLVDEKNKFRSQCILELISDDVHAEIEAQIRESLRKPGVTLQEEEEV